MIKTKEDFVNIETMLHTEGWKLFQEFAQSVSQGFLSKALSATDKDEILVELTKYKAVRDIVQGVFGDYKNNYNKYKIGEN